MILFKATEIRQGSNKVQKEIETLTMNLENQLRQKIRNAAKNQFKLRSHLYKKNNLQKNKLDVIQPCTYILYSLETRKPHDLQLIIYQTAHYRIRA